MEMRKWTSRRLSFAILSLLLVVGAFAYSNGRFRSAPSNIEIADASHTELGLSFVTPRSWKLLGSSSMGIFEVRTLGTSSTWFRISQSEQAITARGALDTVDTTGRLAVRSYINKAGLTVWKAEYGLAKPEGSYGSDLAQAALYAIKEANVLYTFEGSVSPSTPAQDALYKSQIDSVMDSVAISR